jgi:hypothetical protein
MSRARVWSIGWNARIWLFGGGLVAGWGGVAIGAQDAGIPTLHVYENLIQIPVIVLDPLGAPLEPIDPRRFAISIDSGPRFRPTVRLEGDDPISLSILLDARGPEDDLLPKIDVAIAGLAPLSLQARDQVSVYALDCTLIETLDDAPAEQERLRRAVDSALRSWTYRRQNKHRSDCNPTLHLSDALTFVMDGLHRLPGRRVMLAITDGNDKGSKYSWNDVRTYATATGVAVFGMVYSPSVFGQYRTTSYGDAFRSVCELSGGMIFPSNGRDVAETLQRFTKTVRERYIVEFPPPFNSTAGGHRLLVTIDKLDAFIRPAGITVPMADPAVLADPTTVPADPSRAPVAGIRQVLIKPQ